MEGAKICPAPLVVFVPETLKHGFVFAVSALVLVSRRGNVFVLRFESCSLEGRASHHLSLLLKLLRCQLDRLSPLFIALGLDRVWAHDERTRIDGSVVIVDRSPNLPRARSHRSVAVIAKLEVNGLGPLTVWTSPLLTKISHFPNIKYNH